MILAERDRLLADTTLLGRAWCEAWTDAIDSWLAGLYNGVFGDQTGVCLLVVGGTGRREMAPRSDIDVMVIHRKSAKQIEAGLADLWYPIWDTGIHLGHAVRAANQKLSVGADQLDTATTMLAGRWIAGDRALADEVLQAAHKSWRADAGAWLTLLRERGLARHRADGEVAFLLEPNIKEGRGGLRDMHELRWIDAAGKGIATEAPAALGAAYDTLLRARVALHRVAPIAGEVLRLEDQDAIAPAGSFGTADDLMAAVSSAARTVSWQFDRAWHAVARSAKGPMKPRPLASGVTLRNGEVELGVDVSPELDPTLMLQVAVGAARSESPIATRALETLNERTPGVAAAVADGRDAGTGGVVAGGSAGDPRARVARPGRVVQPHASRVGAGSLASAAQRVPPLHRRSAPVGGGGPGRAARRPRRPAGSLGDRCAAARHRQGLPG